MHEIKVKKSSNGYGNGFKSTNNIPYMSLRLFMANLPDHKKRDHVFSWITCFALTVRMFAPSSLIGIIAASSHKACKSLPEYPIN
jgi:hypothetical protein